MAAQKVMYVRCTGAYIPTVSATNVWEGLSKLLGPIPGVVVTLFSLYFAYRRVTHRVLVSFAVGANKLTASGIVELTLVNRRDRPVLIFSVYAVVDGRVLLEVEQFSPPLVMKPLECVQIRPKPFSAYYLDGDEYDALLRPTQRVEVYLGLEHRVVRCKVMTPANLLVHKRFKELRQTSKVTKVFNQTVYGTSLLYAVVYEIDAIQKTAFITPKGLIVGDWIYPTNCLPELAIANEGAVQKALAENPSTSRQRFLVKRLT